MVAESAVSALQDKCHRAEKLVISHQMRADEAEASLEALKEELGGLKATVARIGSLCVEVTPLAEARSRP